MTVYVGIKFHADNSNKAKIEAISDTLTGCGLQSVCVRRDVEDWGRVELSADALMRETIRAYRNL